jgi:O-acetylhomoserine (thiol)-lyase
VIVESGKFPWDNGLFPMMTEPSKGYHGVRFFETFGDFGWIMKARLETLRTFGPALSPFNAFLFLQGLETLALRMERHCANGLVIARFLKEHPAVAWVNYPGLPGSRYHELSKKYLPRGAGSIFTFGIRGGMEAGVRFIESVQVLSHLANVGDAKSLIIHPASTTHRQLSDQELQAAGVRPGSIRLSVGTETPGDLIWDLEQGFACVSTTAEAADAKVATA